MRNWLRLSAFLLISLLCNSQSCNDSEESEAKLREDRFQTSMDSLSANLTSGTPSGSVIRSYESSAIQKLGDFTDYMNILADSSTAGEFRKQVKKMIGSLFISQGITIRTNGKYPGYPESLLLTDIIQAGDKSVPVSFKIEPDSSWVARPFSKVNDSLFSGELRFRFTTIYYSGKNSPPEKHSSGRVWIFLSRNEKNFGEKKLKVWEVYLGDIELE